MQAPPLVILHLAPSCSIRQREVGRPPACAATSERSAQIPAANISVRARSDADFRPVSSVTRLSIRSTSVSQSDIRNLRTGLASVS